MIIQPLKVTRTIEGISQRELSELTGLTTATISHIETGRHSPQKATREKIEKALGRKVDWDVTVANGVHRQALKN